MKKHILLQFIFLLGATIAFSQVTLTGKMVDENEEALSFATVALIHPIDSTLLFFGVTKDDGVFQIKRVKKGSYLMQYSFVGMQTSYEPIEIDGSKDIDIGQVTLSRSNLDEVIVTAELIPLKFMSDTLEFDVRAFKTREGAEVEELLEKLPGVEVDEDGNIKAQGEDVVQILVDGKEFFGKDTKVATKNLPAKALEKVQVFDRKSEESTFTGIDDGVRDRTINLMLNKEHKKGYFGQIEAGIGTNDVYKAEGKVYRFSSTIQTAILGHYNNINEFGYSHRGNNQFGQGTKGLNTSLAGGLNLSYNTKGGYNRYFASYLGNNRIQDLIQTNTSENFLEFGSYLQESYLDQREVTQPHKVNFGIRQDFAKNQRFILDGDFNSSILESTSLSITDSWQNENPVLNGENNTTSNGNDIAINASASHIAKFNGDKTQFKTNIKAAYNKDNTTHDWTNLITYINPSAQVLVDQYRDNENENSNYSIHPSLIQKLNSTWSLNLGAKVGTASNGFVQEEAFLNSEGVYIESVYPDFETNLLSFMPTLGLNRVVEKSQLNIRLSATSNTFDKLLSESSDGKTNYLAFTPSADYQFEYKPGRKINARLSSSVGMPSVGQLYPVVDSINQLAVFQGNINLNPEKRYNATFTWSVFDQFSFTSFFVRLRANYVDDDISWSQNIDENFIKTTMPVNVDNASSISSYMDFSTPIRTLGMNINLSSNESYNKSIVFINNQENINTSFSHGLKLNLENRNKQKWSVLVGGSINLTQSKFSISEAQNNTYYNIGYHSNLRFTPNKKWNFQLNGNVINYNSQSFDEQVSIPLVGGLISYSFLDAEKMTISIKANDLLNKYIGFRQSTSANYVSQSEWNTLSRYVMLSLKYRFR